MIYKLFYRRFIIVFYKQIEIVFLDNKKKPVKFYTASFNFEIDEYLRERFTENVENEINISLEDAKRDFKILLIDESGKLFSETLHKVDLKKQDYDLILSVYTFFFEVQKECLFEAIAIQQQNPCFRDRTGEENYNFDAGNYLCNTEKRKYARFIMCEGDLVKFDYINKNRCLCSFTKDQALFITMRINEKAAIEFYKKDS